MLAIAYHFHVLPRHREPFRHAYQAAREALSQTLGLVSHELYDPRERGEAFSLLLAWDSESSFIRFTRTWLGVWMLNGMGFERAAFAAPIQTDVGESAGMNGTHPRRGGVEDPIVPGESGGSVRPRKHQNVEPMRRAVEPRTHARDASAQQATEAAELASTGTTRPTKAPRP